MHTLQSVTHKVWAGCRSMRCWAVPARAEGFKVAQGVPRLPVAGGRIHTPCETGVNMPRAPRHDAERAFGRRGATTGGKMLDRPSEFVQGNDCRFHRRVGAIPGGSLLRQTALIIDHEPHGGPPRVQYTPYSRMCQSSLAKVFHYIAAACGPSATGRGCFFTSSIITVTHPHWRLAGASNQVDGRNTHSLRIFRRSERKMQKGAEYRKRHISRRLSPLPAGFSFPPSENTSRRAGRPWGSTFPVARTVRPRDPKLFDFISPAKSRAG